MMKTLRVIGGWKSADQLSKSEVVNKLWKEREQHRKKETMKEKFEK